MAQIKPDVLRELRKRRRWSQADLADRSRVDKQTISRIERGRIENVRSHTLRALADALKHSVGVLTGEAPLPAEQVATPWAEMSDMQIRLPNDARNALTLIAERYRVRPNKILALAPFLFAWAAEASLQAREENLREFEQRVAEVVALESRFSHLSFFLTTNFRAEDIVRSERESIGQRDLFGSTLPVDDPEIVNTDAPPGSNNPFVSFLQTLGEALGDERLGFSGWDERGAPSYRVGLDEALALVGGDMEAAGAIAHGVAALHAMPPEARNGGEDARAAWAKAELRRYVMEFDPNLFDLSGRDEVPANHGADQ
jgi:transcriptional regulator with XRE-family HTH domain